VRYRLQSFGEAEIKKQRKKQVLLSCPTFSVGGGAGRSRAEQGGAGRSKGSGKKQTKKRREEKYHLFISTSAAAATAAAAQALYFTSSTTTTSLSLLCQSALVLTCLMFGTTSIPTCGSFPVCN
jgi:hypothetical protein